MGTWTGCRLCEAGFPRESGVHYGTQALGMIEPTRCEATGPRPADRDKRTLMVHAAALLYAADLTTEHLWPVDWSHEKARTAAVKRRGHAPGGRRRRGDVSSCKSCSAPITWIRSPAGRSIPCDPPVVAVVTDEGRVVHGRVSHFATCPQAAQHRRGKPVAAAEGEG